MKNINFCNQYQMPKVHQYCGEIPIGIIGFHRARRMERGGKTAVHFYEDDSYFECIWSRPERYFGMLKRFRCVISPDFSVYADMTLPQVMWNSYRNKYLAALWQSEGIEVIPNVSWSREWSYGFCFEGFPIHSVIAINSTGTGIDPFCKRLWIRGYEKAVETLEPVHIIRYGSKHEGEYEEISTYFRNDNYNNINYRRKNYGR